MNAFEQGYKDFGKGQTTNPYERDTPKHRDWEFGFNKAYGRNLASLRGNEDRRGSQRVYSEEKA